VNRGPAAALAALAIAAGAACTVTRPGTLRLLPDGPVIPVEVTVEEDVIFIAGTDPTTGERLSGRLVSEQTATRRAPPLPMGGPGPGPSGSAPAPLLAQPASIMTVSGTLEGDRGTVLACDAQVERRMRLRGAGACHPGRAGEDGPTYRLEF